MAVEIGALRALLSLDSSAFEKGAKRAQSSLGSMRKQFAAVSAVAAAAGAAMGAAARVGANEIDKSAKAARRLGSSLGGFRALELAADDAGVNLSSLTNDVQTIDREIASIGKSGNAKRALDELGISADELADKDADEKLALIADRVKELGLTSGETTSILRDLGVRNREMVLLVAQGGDALRTARQDIEDYGLAVSDVDASAIEAANDAISRLSVVGQYLRQELAIALVPAMGAFAQAITDSMREGGLLRSVLDGLIDNMARLATYVGTAVALVGAKFVGALVLAKVATFSLSGALVLLRGALIRTGIGALIVGAGELVYWFGKLVSASGSFGTALSQVFDLGKAVFYGIGETASGLGWIMAGVASGILGSFVRVFAEIGKAWDLLVNGMATAWNGIAGTALGETLGLGELGMSNIGGTLQGVTDGLFANAESSIIEGTKRIRTAGDGIAEAFGAIKDTVKGATTDVEDGGDAADRYADAMDNLADSANGGGGGGAAKAVKDVKDETKEFETALDSVESTAKGAFGDIVTGAKTAKEALKDVLDNLARLLANSAFESLFGGAFDSGSGLGKIFAGLFDSGGNIPSGQFGIVGERGPEIVTGPAKVTSRAATAQMMGGGTGGNVHVTVGVDDSGALTAAVTNIAGNVVASAAPGLIAAGDRRTPTRIDNYGARRG